MSDAMPLEVFSCIFYSSSSWGCFPTVYHVLVINNSYFFAAYCVVAEESAGRQIPIAFLERVKDDFLSKYGGGKAAAAPANGLNKEFGYHVIRVYAALLTFWSMLADMNMLICRSKLKEHMRYCVDHPEEISKLAKVKAQVSEVKGVMMENIEKVCLLSFYVLVILL